MGAGSDPPLRRTLVSAVAAVVALVAPTTAVASELIGRDASDVRIEADAQGRALISFRSGGQTKRLLAWGAIDARPPSRVRPQVAFQLSSGGSIGSNTCGRYTGPPLAWQVAACTASDGSHWAVQAWQRLLPNYGSPASPDRAARELRLSHWTGAPAKLEVWTDWSYRRFHHLYGRLTYRGQGVFGFRSTRFGVPLDTYGRNVFVDTFDSGYGSAWMRENSFLTHAPGGGFCYGFYPHGAHGVGSGKRYRATVIGPGVTPDVMWQGPAPAAYDAAVDDGANVSQRELLAGDSRCVVN